MFNAALFTIAKTWKQPKYPLTEEWIKKMCYMYTIKYYLAINWYQIFIHAKTGMNIEDITLSKRSQTEKLYTVLLYSVDLFKIENP